MPPWKHHHPQLFVFKCILRYSHEKGCFLRSTPDSGRQPSSEFLSGKFEKQFVRLSILMIAVPFIDIDSKLNKELCFCSISSFGWQMNSQRRSNCFCTPETSAVTTSATVFPTRDIWGALKTHAAPRSHVTTNWPVVSIIFAADALLSGLIRRGNLFVRRH